MLTSSIWNRAKMFRCKNKIVKMTQFSHKKLPVTTWIKNLARSKMILTIKSRSLKRTTWKKMWARIIYWLLQKSRRSKTLQAHFKWKPHHQLKNMQKSLLCKNLYQLCKLISNSKMTETQNSKMMHTQMLICIPSKKRLSEIYIQKKTRFQKLKVHRLNVGLSII